jgi:ABC-type oligopeptide transport system ATPase subunit
MNLGGIVETADTQSLFASPRHPYLMSPVKRTAHGFPSPRGLIVKFLH